jgi:hypothetical protein
VNPLGADIQLFRRPQPEDDIAHLAESINVPEPLGVRLMALAIKEAQASTVPTPDERRDDDYGADESLTLWRPGPPLAQVPVNEIRICNLGMFSTRAATSSVGTTKRRWRRCDRCGSRARPRAAR